MACYIMQSMLTEKGRPLFIDDMAGRACADKLAMVREAAAGIGVTINQAYLVMGDQDFLVIAEAPDDATMAKFAMAIGAPGNVTTKTMRAFDENETQELFASGSAEKVLRTFTTDG